MTPIERLKLVAELTALHNTAPEANEADRVKQSERIHEVRSLLTGNEDENEGKAEPLEWHEISGAKLPPPYFPCVITPAEAARSPFFKHLYDEQQRIVKEIRIEDGKAMFAVPSGTAIEKGDQIPNDASLLVVIRNDASAFQVAPKTKGVSKHVTARWLELNFLPSPAGHLPGLHERGFGPMAEDDIGNSAVC